MSSNYKALQTLIKADGVVISSLMLNNNKVGMITQISNNPVIIRVEWFHDGGKGYEFFINEIPDSAYSNWVASGIYYGY